MNISFRPATLQDVPLLAAIETACFADAWNDDMLMQELTMGGSVYTIMQVDEVPVGYYAYMHILDEAHILNVAVLPAYQGRGLGRQMMWHLLSNLPDDVVAVTLEVRVSNTRARRLYQSMGFRLAGIRPGYYMDKEDAAIYWWAKGEAHAVSSPHG